MQYLVRIDAWDPIAGATISLYAASHDDPAVCHALSSTWWPTISKLPALGYDFFDGAFGAQIAAPTSSLTMQLEPWPNFARYSFADARFRLWSGDTIDPANVWTQRVEARVTAQPTVKDGAANVSFAVDDRWLDGALLTTYAGTTGAEGPAAMKGQAKPLALGAPRYVPGKLIDSVNSVFQVSAYGAVQEFEAALEKLVRFGAPAADYASYATLIAATVAPGAWATCKAAGMARFGAPTVGQVSFLLKGDVAGSDGWARKPGQLIRRLAQMSGGTGKIDDASLNALDVARPFNLSLYAGEQTNAREQIQRIAASVNAVAGVSWMAKLFVLPIAIGTPTITLAADGSSLPPVTDVEQLAIDPPFKSLAITAERTWAVHGLDDIAFTAPLLPLGTFSASTVYREGNIVSLADGSEWLYVNMTPTSGNAPPASGTSNTWWSRTKPPTAKQLDLTASSSMFRFDAAGAPIAQTITFSVTKQNTAATTVWTILDSLGAVLATGSAAAIAATAYFSTSGADQLSMTHTQFANFIAVGPVRETFTVVASAIDGGVTVTDQKSVSKVQDGAAGSAGLNSATVFIYQRAASPPTLPSASTSYTFATGALTGLNNGWTTAIPAGTNPLYVSAATASANTPTDTIGSGEWAAAAILAQNGSTGPAGLNTASVFIYQRSAIAPTLPSATTTYTFATGGLTGLNNGWTRTVPAGANPLYLSVATASANTATDTIAAGEWAAATVLVENGATGSTGADGLNIATPLIYQRSATAPTLPSATTTYTFASGTLTGLNNGWSQSIPAGSNPLYVSAATAAASTATDTVAAGEWSAAVILAQDGPTGSAGLNSASVFIYQRATSAPAVPSATTTYTFATGGLTGLNNGWSRTVPAGADPLYVSIATAIASTSTDTIATGEWSAAAVLVENGAAAVTGYLTNEAHTVPADSAGTVLSYAGATGSFKVLAGGVDVSSSFSLATKSGGNPQALTVGYASQVYTVTAGLDAGEDLATLTIVATGSGSYAGVTVEKTFTLAKSKSGATGTTGASAKLISLIASTQTFRFDKSGTPYTQTASFTALRQNTVAAITWTLTDNTGAVLYTGNAAGLAAIGSGLYFTNPGADALTQTQTQYAALVSNTAREALTLTITATDGVTLTDRVTYVKVRDGADGAAGPAGINSATVFIYQRAASSPTLPSATTTYTFATGALTGLNNGWSTSIPAGTDPLYVSAATAAAATATDAITAGEWSAATIFAQNGAAGSAGTAGLNSASVFIYQRAASSPTLPSVTTTYTFATGALASLNNGWTRAIPAGTDPLYFSVATAVANTATDTIAAGEWAAAAILVQNGAAGEYRDIKFKRSLSQPATPTDAAAAGWSDGVPAGTDTLWQIVAAKNADGTLIGAWSTPAQQTGFTPRGAYAAGTTYYLNNVVTYGGGSYIAVQNNFTGQAPSGTAQATAYWDVYAAPGDPGTPATLPSAFSATINLASGSAVNLRTVANAAGYTGLSNATITFNVPNGVTIRGLGGGGIGIDTGTWPAGYTIALTLVVQSGGVVDGGGGHGTGQGGGDAIVCRANMTGGVTINSGGIVRGGGGGGSGGLATASGKFGGGGGGGGAPNGSGGMGQYGSIGDGDNGQDGTVSGGGTGGTPGGGSGGGYGTAGGASTNGGGSGGPAGYAVRKNGNTVTVTNSGTMTGTAA